MIDIPKNNIIRQSNRSNNLGDIVESFNLDLTSNLGSTRLARCKSVALSSDPNTPTDFGYSQQGVAAIADFNGTIYAVSGNSVWAGGNSPFDTFTRDSTYTPADANHARSDMVVFNDSLVVASLNSIQRFSSGSWTNVVSGLSTNHFRLMVVFDSTLYWVDERYKIKRINTSWVNATSGSQTLDLDLDGYSISFFEAADDRIWIGLVDTFGVGSGKTYVYEWDGQTENTPTRRYTINARGVLSGTMVGNTPVVVDTNGRVLQFNGGGFTEIDRFPLNYESVWYQIGGSFSDRAIHPRGMAYDSVNDEILFNISTLKDDSTANSPEFMDMPSGVWAWNRETGLYHKYSPSADNDSVTGESITDYGQFRTHEAGPLEILYTETPTSTDGGRIIFGSSIFLGSGINENDRRIGLFTNDTKDNTQKAGYFITSKLMNGVEDIWQKVYAIYNKLKNSSDKIVVKYRTEEDTPTKATVSWTNTSTITTTTDLSAYSEGDELQIIQGKGSGKSAHITSISENSGTYTVVLDETFTGATGTSVGKFSKWIKAGSITQNDEKQWKELVFPKKNTSPWIQIKVFMQFTGKDELLKLRVINKKHINE